MLIVMKQDIKSESKQWIFYGNTKAYYIGSMVCLIGHSQIVRLIVINGIIVD